MMELLLSLLGGKLKGISTRNRSDGARAVNLELGEPEVRPDAGAQGLLDNNIHLSGSRFGQEAKFPSRSGGLAWQMHTGFLGNTRANTAHRQNPGRGRQFSG